MQSARSLNHWFTVLSAVSMSAASVAVFLLMPMLVGSMVEQLGLTEAQAGYRLSSYFAGYTLICLSGYFWIRRFNWQYTAALAYLLLILGLLMSGWVDTTLLYLTLFIAGAGAGALLGLSLTLISDMENPDRIFGWQMLAQQSLPAVLLFILPLVLADNAGFHNLVVVIVVALSLTLFSLKGIPSAGNKSTEISTGGFEWHQDRKVLFMLVAVGLYFTALSGVWAFVERFADAQGIRAEDSGFALALALVAGAVGGIVAAVIAGRVSRAAILVVLSITFILVFSGYATDFSFWGFLIASMTFSFCWNVCMAFQQGLIAELDVRGRFMVLLPAAIAAGAMLGPGLAGYLISVSGYNVMLGVMGIALIVLTLPFVTRRQQPLLPPTNSTVNFNEVH